MKKRTIIIFGLLLLGGIGWKAAFPTPEAAPKYTSVVIQKSDLTQEVSVTGKMEALVKADISFEKSGRVIASYAVVGSTVGKGQLLAVLDNSDLSAQLSQAMAGIESAQARVAQSEAALTGQKAKLQELQKGTRVEELKITQTKLTGNQQSIFDAKINLQNVQNKATIDLSNLIADIPTIINDSYSKADFAVHSQLDMLFADYFHSVQPIFDMTDGQLQSDLKWSANNIGNDLLKFNKATDPDQAKTHLQTALEFLNLTRDALNNSVGIAPTKLAEYKANINASISTINSQISSIDEKIQVIAAQSAINSTAVSQAEAQLNTSQAGLEGTKAELSLKETGYSEDQILAQQSAVAQAQANVADAQAQVKQAQSSAQSIQSQLEKGQIKAPFDGIVTKKNLHVGEIASSNSIAISMIQGLEFKIETYIPESDISKVSVGNPAKITLDAYGGDVEFKAFVSELEPTETTVEGVATYKTTLRFYEPDDRIKSGMTANIDIMTASRTNVITVPQRAVSRNNQWTIVQVVTHNVIRDRKVKTGLKGSDGNIEITGGIREGEEIVTFIEDVND